MGFRGFRNFSLHVIKGLFNNNYYSFICSFSTIMIFKPLTVNRTIFLKNDLKKLKPFFNKLVDKSIF
jgi:hypothetical protein